MIFLKMISDKFMVFVVAIAVAVVLWLEYLRGDYIHIALMLVFGVTVGLICLFFGVIPNRLSVWDAWQINRSVKKRRKAS